MAVIVEVEDVSLVELKVVQERLVAWQVGVEQHPLLLHLVHKELKDVQERLVAWQVEVGVEGHPLLLHLVHKEPA